MATLTAWKFSTPHGADDALTKLELHGEMPIKGMGGHGQPATGQRSRGAVTS